MLKMYKLTNLSETICNLDSILIENNLILSFRLVNILEKIHL